jgi:translation initiation factor IF-2
MPRKRIHELAKEWGMDTTQVISKLEEAGIHGKKAQSALTESEIALIRPGAILQEAHALVLGEEKLVQQRVVTEVDQGSEHLVTAREEVRETRVRADVIRRRATREVLHEEEPVMPEPQPSEPQPSPSVEEPFTVPQPLAFELSFEEPPPLPELPTEPAIPVSAEPESEPTPGAPEPPLPPPVSPLPTAAPVPPVSTAPLQQKQASLAATPVATPVAQPVAEPPRPSRVLGRIDLGKLTEAKPRPEVRPRPQPPPASPMPSGAREPSREPAAVSPAEAPGVVSKRPKKRKVIRKPELVEAQEKELRLPKTARKKRALPGKELKQTEITVPRASKRVIRISEVVTVGDLARQLGVKAGEVIKKLINLGIMATINQVLDADTAALVAADFDYTIENVAFDVESVLEVGHEAHNGEEKLEPRPPVVTIMGHVDHGKTSLLDAIRKTNVTAQEHGGITQHIGAYSVQVDGRSVTFLDTPGHEAFTAMRARGAKVTDIVTLVVAADDGVMPQTVEAINHARAAGVPLIVAVNKMDRPDADLEKVKRELMNYGLVSEELGGDTIFAPVSAKTGEGIPHLLEMLLLQADIMELRAHPDKLARGVIVEAKLDRGRGPVATVLVQEGQLKVGDAFVCGTQYGRVRAMIDSWGNKVEKASPAMPVEILGLTGVPEAGDMFIAVGDEAKARQVAEHRRTKRRETELTKSSGRTTLEDFYQQAQSGEVQELRVIIKADVQGSVGAVSEALTRLSTNEVKLTILHASVGGISESDVLLASASKGIILGFSVRPESKAMQLAEREGVEIRLYNIIYEVIEDVRAALEGLLAPTYREKPLGRAEVRQVFTISRMGVIAGCMVSEGRLLRGALARLVRDHAVAHQGRIASLRRFKDDVREVAAGAECGVSLENFQDIKVGDVIEAYELEQVLRRLETRPHEVERRV